MAFSYVFDLNETIEIHIQELLGLLVVILLVLLLALCMYCNVNERQLGMLKYQCLLFFPFVMKLFNVFTFKYAIML